VLSFVAATGGAAWAESHEPTVTSHGISAFGALKYEPDFPHFDYVNPDAPQGGTISFRGTLASQTFDSLNYFILQGEPAQGLERIYDTLMVEAFDEPDAVYGLLAETITYPEDRSWVIYTLRDGARFSDGHPVTAEDIVFTIETLQEKGKPFFTFRVEDVVSAEALSDREVKVTFKDDAPKRDLIKQVGLVETIPKHYYDEVEFA
jgi:microcin C transport system substrate-binding protein